jgi:hypothetical protein
MGTTASPLRGLPASMEFVIYYGGASPGDGNFADIVAIDGEIVEVLAERERRKKKQSD